MEPCTCTPDSEIQCFYCITLMNLINGIFWGKSPGTSENLSPKTETLNCNPWSAKWYKVWKNKSGPLSCSLVDSKKLTTFSHDVAEWNTYLKIEWVSLANGCKILKIQNGDTKMTLNSMYMYFSFKNIKTIKEMVLENWFGEWRVISLCITYMYCKSEAELCQGNCLHKLDAQDIT